MVCHGERDPAEKKSSIFWSRVFAVVVVSVHSHGVQSFAKTFEACLMTYCINTEPIRNVEPGRLHVFLLGDARCRERFRLYLVGIDFIEQGSLKRSREQVVELAHGDAFTEFVEVEHPVAVGVI